MEVAHGKCTGSTYCRNACPVNVFEMRARDRFEGATDEALVVTKFQIRAEQSWVINGPDCIMCDAYLFECKGECITIVDDEGAVHQSTYK